MPIKPTTASEALLAETLGELVQLRTQVAGVVDSLEPALVLVAAAKDKALSDMAAEQSKQTQAMLSALEKGIKAAEGRLDRAGREIARDMVRQDGIPFAKMLLMVCLASAIAAIAGLYAGYWWFGHDLRAAAELGKAVADVWDWLPNNCRASIERAY